jgi:ADP-heptose:LPS heptosyltransferase
MKIVDLLKDIVRIVLCMLVDSLASQKVNIQDKSIVILRLDVIGDYILFRNFLEILKASTKYKNYRVTLIGNEVFKDLALSIDNTFVDDFIFFIPGKMTRNYIYRYKIVKQITARGFDTLICPVYSREFYVGELMTRRITALNKIGIAPNMTNMSSWQKRISRNYYTKLISTPNEVMFEFNRTKLFFEELLNYKIDFKKPFINLNDNLNSKLPKKYVVFFIGATTSFRCWPVENFAKVARYILNNNHNLNVLICGGTAEEIEAKKLVNILQDKRVYNYTGKTTLVEFIEIISKARLLLSNESNAPHIAMAFSIYTIVLYNGFNFKRFIPYPKDISNKYFPIYHPKIDNNLKKYEITSNKRGYSKVLDMKDITVDRVVNKISDLNFN